jgi:hypothetical protein
MGIREILQGDRIYFDTNIFIYAFEEYPEYISLLKAKSSSQPPESEQSLDRRSDCLMPFTLHQPAYPDVIHS